MSEGAIHPSSLTLAERGRWIVLIMAFLGWYFAGVQMAITSLASNSAAKDLLSRAGEFEGLDSEATNELSKKWFAWYPCAFLFGAATGGWILGRVGDRLGRAKGMALSILCYSTFSLAAYWANDPWQLLSLRFLACLGVGGMWPNGVALASEAWPNVSRPALAGIIGTSANIGIFNLSLLAQKFPVNEETWRWTMLAGASALPLGFLALVIVPESPRWLAERKRRQAGGQNTQPQRMGEIFRPPILKVTVVGIILGTVPAIGAWANTNWTMPWADEAEDAALSSAQTSGGLSSLGTPAAKPPAKGTLKAQLQTSRALAGIVGSLVGGWVAVMLGRRTSYFLISLALLGMCEYMFGFLEPTDSVFIYLFGAIGFTHGLYFGWLPLCLPELFPTHVRSTGTGVSFNFGRIASGFVLLFTGLLMSAFHGDVARIGLITSLIYAAGVLIVFFVPDTAQRQLVD